MSRMLIPKPATHSEHCRLINKYTLNIWGKEKKNSSKYRLHLYPLYGVLKWKVILITRYSEGIFLLYGCHKYIKVLQGIILNHYIYTKAVKRGWKKGTSWGDKEKWKQEYSTWIFPLSKQVVLNTAEQSRVDNSCAQMQTMLLVNLKMLLPTS